MRVFSKDHFNARHGFSETPVWYSWQRMLRRCYDKNNNRYKNYGGRGIRVVERWHVFENFYEDFGKYKPDGYTLDRIDNQKDYCPENCQWITKSENSRKKTTTRYFEYNGKKLSLTQLSECLGIPFSTLRRYLLRNKNNIETCVLKYREKREKKES